MINLYSCFTVFSAAFVVFVEGAAAALVASRLALIKHTVLVLSGKGGVGKSTVSSQLAFTLASKGFQVRALGSLTGPVLANGRWVLAVAFVYIFGGLFCFCRLASLTSTSAALLSRACLV